MDVAALVRETVVVAWLLTLVTMVNVADWPGLIVPKLALTVRVELVTVRLPWVTLVLEMSR